MQRGCDGLYVVNSCHVEIETALVNGWILVNEIGPYVAIVNDHGGTYFAHDHHVHLDHEIGAANWIVSGQGSENVCHAFDDHHLSFCLPVGVRRHVDAVLPISFLLLLFFVSWLLLIVWFLESLVLIQLQDKPDHKMHKCIVNYQSNKMVICTILTIPKFTFRITFWSNEICLHWQFFSSWLKP